VDQSERGKTADRFSEIMKASAEKYKIRYVDHRSKGVPTVAERNALAAASTWKSVLELPNTATKEEVEKAVEKVEATSTSTFEERQARRDAAASDVGSVLGNVARGVRIPGTPNARAIKIRESSYSSNNMQKAEKARSNAKFATRKKAAEVERSNPSFLRKVAALRSAQRNAEEGTPEAAAKRLAALRMPTKAQQEEYATVAKRLTAERRAAEKAMAEKAKRNAAIQRNADAAAASYVSPEKVASRAEKEKINRYSYSGNVGNLSHENMIGNVIDL
jgi:colicin import membrane protein